MKKERTHYIDNQKFLSELKKHGVAIRRAKRLKEEPPQLSEYIGDCFIKIATNMSYRPNFNNYCVDAETEALTQRGWLKYDEITTDDTILSLDVGTNVLRWSSIHEIFVNPNYDGEMFHLTGQGIDALVTPGHKFVSNKSLVPVEKLGRTKHITLMGDAVESVGAGQTFSDSFVELVGWFVTEGSTIKYAKKRDLEVSHYHSLTQNEGWKADRIRACLSDLGILTQERRPRKNLCSWGIPQPVSAMLDKVCPEKILTTEFLVSLTAGQRNILLNAMVAGDGWILKSGARMFCQKNKEAVDRFVMLCALSGIATRTVNRNIISYGKESFINTISLYDKKTVSVQKIDFHGATRPSGGDVRSSEKGSVWSSPLKYEGVIWCPRTEFGTFVCRRGESVYVTGNTYLDEMISDGIENCLIYANNFDPKKSTNAFAYFSQIVWYAFIRRIQKEKRQLSTKYRFIETLGVDDIITQAHDVGEYDTPYIDYLKGQISLAEVDVREVQEKAADMTKRPKYMAKKKTKTTKRGKL